MNNTPTLVRDVPAERERTVYTENRSGFGFPWKATRDGVTGQGFSMSEALFDLEMRLYNNAKRKADEEATDAYAGTGSTGGAYD